MHGNKINKFNKILHFNNLKLCEAIKKSIPKYVGIKEKVQEKKIYLIELIRLKIYKIKTWKKIGKKNGACRQPPPHFLVLEFSSTFIYHVVTSD